jgi:hypothetical protein
MTKTIDYRFNENINFEYEDVLPLHFSADDISFWFLKSTKTLTLNFILLKNGNIIKITPTRDGSIDGFVNDVDYDGSSLLSYNASLKKT